MIRIDSFTVFFKYILVIFFIVYFSFKIFNYFYTGNYCDYFSDIVEQNSQEDIDKTKRCISSMVCEVGDIRLSLLNNDSNEKLKSFSCVRKYKTGVWKW